MDSLMEEEAFVSGSVSSQQLAAAVGQGGGGPTINQPVFKLPIGCSVLARSVELTLGVML